jgi:hypothetical protein
MGGYALNEPPTVIFNFLCGLFVLPVLPERFFSIRIVEFKLEKNLEGTFPGLSSFSHTKGYLDLKACIL